MISKGNNQPLVINYVVNNDLCTGCGVCTAVCPSNVLTMSWNEDGFLVPNINGSCDAQGKCLSVCPTNPIGTTTENDLSEKFLLSTQHENQRIGKYINLYAGYSYNDRLSSSSGGIATYVCRELLKRNYVQHIISIKTSDLDNEYYEYAVCSDQNNLKNFSKTRYYPVTLEDALKKVSDLQGHVAIIGVACFVKAIRLLQKEDNDFNGKIKFIIGIICGGVKSKFYTDFLVKKTNKNKKNINTPQYRIKNIKSDASDYSFGFICKDDGKDLKLRMRDIGDMWGTGLFKSRACDYCQDVTTELADISLGDAWIEPYRADGKGNNIIITRSDIAEDIIKKGIISERISVEKLTISQVIDSQQGSFNHRQEAYAQRIKIGKLANKVVPTIKPRIVNHYFDSYIQQLLRSIIRKKSIEYWKDEKDIENYQKKLNRWLLTLKFWSKVVNKRRKLFKNILKGRK